MAETAPLSTQSPTGTPQQTQAPSTSSGATGSVQRMLRSASFDAGSAMLAPRSPVQAKSKGSSPVRAVQRRDAVQMDEPNQSLASGGVSDGNSSMNPASSGGGGTSSSSSGGSAGGTATADPNVYNDQEGVGETTAGGSNSSNGAAVSVSTARGGSITAGREFEIGKIEGPPMPIPGVPGLFLTVTGGLKAAADVTIAGISSGESEREYQVSVTGTIQGGVEFGAPPLASLYLRAGPVIRASARAAFDSRGLKSVNADITLDSTISVGVQGGSGAFDYNHVLARANIGRFIGVSYNRGRPLVRGQFQMGAALIQAGREAKAAYDRVAGWARAGANAVEGAGRVVSRAWNWITS